MNRMKPHLTSISSTLKRSFLWVAALALLLGACTDDTFSPPTPDTVPGVKVFLNVPAPSVEMTRATTAQNDSYYDPETVYLFVFANNTDDSPLLQLVKGSVVGTTLYAKLEKRSAASYLYIAANYGDVIQNHAATWNETKPTLATIKQTLKKSLPLDNGALASFIAPQPMLAETAVEKIEESTQVGSPASPIALVRSTAKISLINQTDNMTIAGATLMNAPRTGYLFPGVTLQAITKHHSRNEVTPAEGAKDCNLYTFESDKTKSTAVIIRAHYLSQEYFYRINLHTKEADYALKRNFNYIVTIKSVTQIGYATAEEARNNPAGNLEYIINVVDNDARDIISDGTFYLGLSNSEYYAFTEEGVSADEDIICTVVHNAPFDLEVTSATIGNIVKEATKDGAGVTTTKLKAMLPKEFATGEIKLKLGSLERTVAVHKISNQPDSKLGSFLSNFVGKEYISAKVDATDSDWLKLTTVGNVDDLDDNMLHDRLENATGTIHIRAKAYTGDNSSPKYRIGHVDFFRSDKTGNARVMIRQNVFDVYTELQGIAKVAPYTYVGTFHRCHQKGERIIRVDAKAIGNVGAGFEWKAYVVSGDFIRLSLTQSPDGGVTRAFYGVGDNTTTFGDAVEQYTVEGDDAKTVISQTGANDIYFRIGLTSTIPAGSHRYGLVALVVNPGKGSEVTRYIFVRQGEEADYLMRPTDSGSEAPFVSPNRPLATKISPFNLTAPKGTSQETVYVDMTGKRGDFVTYPSQGGYLYQIGTKGQGWISDFNNKTIPNWDSGSLSLPWSDAIELCPPGYHAPKGGVETLGAYESFTTNTDVSKASIRQSLWLYPKNGGISETQNFIIGYIADGFFDRQEMYKEVEYSSLQSGGKKKQPIAVNSGSSIAYIGVLSFNPSSLASLFLPMAGYYYNNMNNMAGSLQHTDVGLQGSFFTQSRYSTNAYHTVDYGIMGPADNDPMGEVKFRVDNFTTHVLPMFANSIRCVRD